MAGPARAGVLFYAKNLDVVSAFYEEVLGATVLHADPGPFRERVRR